MERKAVLRNRVVLHLIEKIEHLTYGVMIERLFSQAWPHWSRIWRCEGYRHQNAEFIEKGKANRFPIRCVF